jgi:hypothetical protein
MDIVFCDETKLDAQEKAQLKIVEKEFDKNCRGFTAITGKFIANKEKAVEYSNDDFLEPTAEDLEAFATHNRLLVERLDNIDSRAS